MKFTAQSLRDVWVIEPVVHGDSRGYFCETYRQDLFDEHVGPVRFIQDNESKSSYGVFRGLHYQAGEASQAKLVRVIEGSVLDIIVDLRTASPTFGQWLAVELSADNHRQLFVPRGFAHGFVVLSETAVFSYKVDNAYCPAAEQCIRYDDPTLGLTLPIPADRLCLSAKDLAGKSFADAPKF
jgi:dTDP-4-dehydrorhamnose 3,5-epimerase